MVGLVPFNKRNRSLSANSRFDDFYNVLDDFFSSDWPLKRSLAFDTFKVDVRDNGSEYLIDAEMPGIDKKDIKVEFDDDGKLLISVTKDESGEEKEGNYIHKERRSVSMSRSIYLSDADRNGIKAKLNDGLLSIAVPKEEKIGKSVTIDVD
jgi:HSP20 family protein